MAKERSDLATVSIDPEHPYMHLYRTGDAFTKVPEATHDGVTNLLKSSQQEVYDHVQSSDELEFQIMSSLMNDTHALSKEVTEILTMEGLAIQRLIGSTCWTARRSTQWQTTLMLEQLRIIVSSATSVVDQFVSKYHPHVLLRRCWGALTAIIEVRTLNARTPMWKRVTDSKPGHYAYMQVKSCAPKEGLRPGTFEWLLDTRHAQQRV